MTQVLKRFVPILLAGGVLAGCTTYEPFEGRGGSSGSAQPAYPIRPPPPSQPSSPPPVAAPPPTATAPVESRSLEPTAPPRTNLPSYVTPSTPPGDASPPPPAYQTPPYQPPPYRPPAYQPLPPPPPPPVEAPRPAPRMQTVTKTSVTGKVVDVDGPRVEYTVKKGDNLYAIARKLELDAETLGKDNKLKAPYRLQPGQVLKGPVTKRKAYVVGSGDTLFSIAKRFGVTAKALGAENDLKPGASLKPGKKIRLPEGYKDAGPTKTVTRVPVEAPEPPPYVPPRRPAYVPPAPQRPAPTYTPPAPTYTPAPQRPAQTYPTPQPQAPAYAPPPQRPASQYPFPTPSPTPAPAPPVSRPSNTPPFARPTNPPTNVPGPVIAATPAPSDSQISELGRGRFLWPVRGDIIARFGPKGQGQQNDGINIRAPSGEPVRAAAAGDVVYAGDQVPGFGNLVLIKHADGWVTAYGHLARSDVKMQQKVTQGQQIGAVGATGGVAESQLHFEIRYAPTPADRAKPIDPTLVLPR